MTIFGTNHQYIKREIKRLQLDVSHFLGRGSTRGTKRKDVSRNEIPLEECFVSHGRYIGNQALKKKILKYDLLPYVCSICYHIAEWLGKPAALILDHISGDNEDNRLENLRFLCPFCNVQQETYCRGKTGVERLEFKRLEKEKRELERLNDLEKHVYTQPSQKYIRIPKKPARLLNIVIDKKVCTKCTVSKPSEDFAKNKLRHDGLSHYCRDCTKAMNSSYHERNREKRNTASRAWKEKQKTLPIPLPAEVA